MITMHVFDMIMTVESIRLSMIFSRSLPLRNQSFQTSNTSVTKLPNSMTQAHKTPSTAPFGSRSKLNHETSPGGRKKSQIFKHPQSCSSPRVTNIGRPARIQTGGLFIPIHLQTRHLTLCAGDLSVGRPLMSFSSLGSAVLLHLKTAVSPPLRWQMMMDTEGCKCEADWLPQAEHMKYRWVCLFTCPITSRCGRKDWNRGGCVSMDWWQSKICLRYKTKRWFVIEGQFIFVLSAQFSCLWHWPPVVFVNDSWCRRCFLGNKLSWEINLLARVGPVCENMTCCFHTENNRVTCSRCSLIYRRAECVCCDENTSLEA